MNAADTTSEDEDVRYARAAEAVEQDMGLLLEGVDFDTAYDHLLRIITATGGFWPRAPEVERAAALENVVDELMEAAINRLMAEGSEA